MTGLELYQKIKENEILRAKSIPFIFLTTASDQKVIIDAYELCVQGFFVKPASINELKETVRMIVDYWKVCKRP